MRIATWQEGTDEMSSTARRPNELRDWAVARIGRPAGGGYRDACRRVGTAMTELFGAEVSIRFVTMHSPVISGGTARLSDGRYIVYCARSGSWYHRFGILLHELAHVLLGHRPVELSTHEGLSRLLPHVPRDMITILAGRTDLETKEERAAEALADSILARLTDTALRPRPAGLPSDLPDQVRRVADALEDRSAPEES